MTSREKRWERRTEAPLAVAAAIFLIAYAVPILDRHLDRALTDCCQVVTLVLWSVFGIDYVVRVALADNRMRYVWRHVPDLLMIALPVLRPLRLLRLVQLLRLMNRQAATSLRGRIAIYVGGSTILVVFCAALAVLDAERRDPHANITHFGDAVWWAISTVTTVGYGDRYPVSTEGRFVAVGLMVSGIALLGVVTASIASWLVERVREVEGEEAADIRALSAQIQSLTQEVAALRGLLAQRQQAP